MFKKTLANEITKKVCVYIPKKSYCVFVKPTINFVIDITTKTVRKQYYKHLMKNTLNPIKKFTYFCKLEGLPCNSYVVSNGLKVIASIMFVIGMSLYFLSKFL